MMETANPTSGNTTSPAAAQATDATASKLYGESASGSASQESVSENAASTKDEATSEKAAKSAGAPDKYDLKAPEGREYDNEILAKFSDAAKNLNLTNEQAQGFLNEMGAALETRMTAQLKSVRQAWAESSTTDKEFGGDKLSENMSVAKRALDAFGTESLRSLLNESGLGNHPEIIRFMYRTGRAISQDTMVNGTASASRSRGPMTFGDAATMLYANQPNQTR
jgi:hypothetical protein